MDYVEEPSHETEVKVGEPVKEPCKSPQHNPAGMRHRSPGTYTHTCPICKDTITYTVPKVTM